MVATHGEGAYGNATGVTTPTDHKMAQVAEFLKTGVNTIRAGLLWDGNATVVTGKANMSLDVRAFSIVTTRGATSGAVKWANDATLNLTKDVNGTNLVAPGSNSAYWNVFAWHREFAIDGTDSDPIIAVLVGTPAASPTVPALTSYPGAVSLATVLVPAGTTATNSGTTITQTAPYTTSDGGVVVARTTTERDAYTPAAADTKAKCWVVADGVTYRWNGSAWKGWESDWISYTATLGFTIGTGGSVVNSTRYRWVGGVVEIEFRFVLGTSPAMTSATFTAPFSLRVPIANEIYSSDCFVTNISTSSGPAVVRAVNTSQTVIQVLSNLTGTPASITSSAPWSWASGNALTGRLTVQAA